MNPALVEIRHPGLLTTVQDLGRPGYAHLGVSQSGAADVEALRLANRLVGNDASAAALECTYGGLILRFRHAATIAVTGAVGPISLHGPTGAVVDAFAAASVPAGTELRLGPPAAGLRSYLAVRGGIDAAPMLGSRSTDTLGGLGPAALRAGDLLAIGTLGTGDVDGAQAVAWPAPARLRLVPGPRTAFFTDDALEVLLDSVWTVSGDSNRIGVRLDGPELTRRADRGELPSEPTLPGALQVPPHGRPILLGPDAPVTGGYPVIAVVHSRHLSHCGQLRPGQSLSFTT